jgi:hypothetical protein
LRGIVIVRLTLEDALHGLDRLLQTPGMHVMQGPL